MKTRGTKWPLIAWVIIGGLFNPRNDAGKIPTAWGQIILLLVVPGLYLFGSLGDIQDSPLASFMVDVLLGGSIVFGLVLIWRGYREYSMIHDRNHIEYS